MYDIHILCCKALRTLYSMCYATLSYDVYQAKSYTLKNLMKSKENQPNVVKTML